MYDGSGGFEANLNIGNMAKLSFDPFHVLRLCKGSKWLDTWSLKNSNSMAVGQQAIDNGRSQESATSKYCHPLRHKFLLRILIQNDMDASPLRLRSYR